MERIAEVVQREFAVLGIPEKVAMDYAYRTDLLSDRIEKVAADNAASIAPDEIGEIKPGPEEMESDESYMKGQFTQVDNEELSRKQESGRLARLKELQASLATLQGEIQVLQAGSEDSEKKEAAAEPVEEKEASTPPTEKEASEAPFSHGYNLFA